MYSELSRGFTSINEVVEANLRLGGLQMPGELSKFKNTIKEINDSPDILGYFENA